MGYDMFFEHPDETAGPTTTAMNRAFDALDVAIITGTGVEEARAMYEAFFHVERVDYFRLNVGGMSRWLDFMGELGMLTTERGKWSGLHAYKFWGNSGLLVTPRELKAALRTYDVIPRERVRQVIFTDSPDKATFYGQTIERTELEKEDDLADWDEWIDYLRRAKDQGGFRVC
jgi:hypothetical protein